MSEKSCSNILLAGIVFDVILQHTTGRAKTSLCSILTLMIFECIPHLLLLYAAVAQCVSLSSIEW